MLINNLAALNDYAIDMGIPLNGMFELTQKCNMRCTFCYVCDRNEVAQKTSEKTAGEWLSIIREAADAGMLTCNFTGGEPFMREDFEEIYCKAYDMGLCISIFTNATLIGEKQLSYLKKRIPHYISISLYGSSEESYEEICTCGKGYHQVLASIDKLCATGIPVKIKTLALQPLISEMESIGDLANAYQCPASVDVYLGPGRDGLRKQVNQLRIPLDQIESAVFSFQKGTGMRKVIRTDEQTAYTPMHNNNPILCFAGKSRFFVTNEGKMLGCPMLTCFETDPFQYGFIEAWNRLKKLIDSAQDCEDCLCCPDKRTCYVCPAIRLQETGSVTQCSEYLKSLARALSPLTFENIG